MRSNDILVVGPAWVGDMVMAQAVCKLLKSRSPAACIDMLAPNWSLPVVSRMPEVRNGYALPAGHGELALGARWNLARRLRAHNYARAVVLPRSLKAALIPWLAGVPHRTGFRGEMRYGLINDIRPYRTRALDQTVKRYVSLGTDAGESLPPVPKPALRVSPEGKQAAMERFALAGDPPAVAMMVGAEFGPAKCWPAEYFRRLADMLHDAGHQVWLLGSSNDESAAAAVAAGGRARNLCGRTTLEEAIDLLACCRQAVTNDSGLMHIAAAVGVRVVALYGSSSPSYTPPLTDDKVVHYLGIPCSPCFQRRCPLGHFRCLRDISPESVFASLQLGTGPDPSPIRE